jgi:hypothetical protein
MFFKYSSAVSKEKFHLGGMAPLQWTHSVRATRDTLVADYSAPSINSRHRITYHALIAI